MKVWAIAVAAALAASGCSALASATDSVEVESGLSRFVTELRTMPGVIDADYTTELTFDGGDSGTVMVTARDLADDELLAIAIATTEALGAAPLSNAYIEFTLSTGAGRLLTFVSYDYSTSELAAELQYRSDLSAAYGEQLGIGFDEGSREIHTLVRSPDPDWDAMRAIADYSILEADWGFPGLAVNGPLPSAATTDLFDFMSKRVAPRDDLSESAATTFDIIARGDRVILTLINRSFDSPGVSPLAEDWPDLADIASYLASSSLVTPSVRLAGAGPEAGAGFLGVCPTTVFASPEDAAVAAALGAGWAPGLCLVD